jgi:hypothetical protein
MRRTKILSVADNLVEIRIEYFLITKENKNCLQVSFYDISLHIIPSELSQQIKVLCIAEIRHGKE